MPRHAQVGPSHMLPLLQRSLRALSRIISRQASEVSAALPSDVASAAVSSAALPPALTSAALPVGSEAATSSGGRFNSALGSFLESEDNDIASGGS
jgi:hypothetical protein